MLRAAYTTCFQFTSACNYYKHAPKESLQESVETLVFKFTS